MKPGHIILISVLGTALAVGIFFLIKGKRNKSDDNEDVINTPEPKWPLKAGAEGKWVSDLQLAIQKAFGNSTIGANGITGKWEKGGELDFYLKQFLGKTQIDSKADYVKLMHTLNTY